MTPFFRSAGRYVAGATLVALAGCADLQSTGTGPAAEAPVYHVGDRWVYRAQDGFRVPVVWDETHEVTAIGADGITVRITQKGPSVDNERAERLAAPGRVLVGALFDSETRRFTPALDRYAFPLQQGQSWNQWVNSYDEATEREGQINHYVRVRGWEKITTPAGTYDAIALRVTMRLDDEEFWRYPTTCNYLIWYAPAVGATVREEKDAEYREKGDAMDGQGNIRAQHTLLELVSYSPGR